MKKNLGKLKTNFYMKLLQKRYKKSKNPYMLGIGMFIFIIISLLSINNISAFPSYSSYCSSCHPNDMPTTWISVTVDSQTPNDITYSVSGSNIYGDNEGWAVFDQSQTNIDNGYDSGYFTLPKDGLTYPVYWVDSGSGLGGSAVEYVTTPEVNNTTPDTPIINGPTTSITHPYFIPHETIRPPARWCIINIFMCDYPLHFATSSPHFFLDAKRAILPQH